MCKFSFENKCQDVSGHVECSGTIKEMCDCPRWIGKKFTYIESVVKHSTYNKMIEQGLV